MKVALVGPLAGLKRTDVVCTILPSKMRLSLGAGAPALEGEFEARVNEQGSFWQFEEPSAPGSARMLVVNLEKKTAAADWVRQLRAIATTASS